MVAGPILMYPGAVCIGVVGVKSPNCMAADAVIGFKVDPGSKISVIARFLVLPLMLIGLFGL